jgi:hypothetical protein
LERGDGSIHAQTDVAEETGERVKGGQSALTC